MNLDVIFLNALFEHMGQIRFSSFSVMNFV